jgi:hypothetical protein
MAVASTEGRNDFDFLIGSWAITNIRLKQRLAENDDWYEFPATSVCRKILMGTGNLEEMDIPQQAFAGMTVRLYNPRDGLWSIYWSDSRSNTMFPPTLGRFEDGRGVFLGEDIDDGRPVRVRFLWTPSRETPRWEQAFSIDGGETWETNWVMKFSPMG